MLTHINAQNLPKMVDVSNKQPTMRLAKASGQIKMSQEAFDIVINNTAQKGPVLQTAVVAAVLAAKKTGDLIPMCHPLGLSAVDIEVKQLSDLPGFRLIATAKLSGNTGVEMEALTAVSVGLLTIYDMVKAVDKSMVISDIYLDYKSGGKSGIYERAK